VAAPPGASPTTAPGATTAASAGGAASTGLACTSPATPTISQTEGPYYKAGAPQKVSLLESGMTGTHLTLTGYVVNTSCQPLANAKVDVWQADASGQYDNSGYRLRGYVMTDASGRFTIETVIPGEYPGRTEHIHVKVTPSGGSTLTTQLYFPDAASANQSDGIFDPSMLLAMTPSGSGYIGTYTFVLRV
jgi:protocatechuate 3,4-dioxygenase beta subunit